MAKLKPLRIFVLWLLTIALFDTRPIKAESSVTVNYIKPGWTIIDTLDLWGTAHSDNAPITNIFITLGGVKILEQPYQASYGQTISFEFSPRIHLYGELALVVTAQDASGATFSSQTLTDYFASQLSVRLLAPTTTNITVPLGQGIPISADSEVDFGRVSGLYFSVDNGSDYPTTYITPSATQFTWYPPGVGNYSISLVPFIDMGGAVQKASFTATVTPWRLPVIARWSPYLATTTNGGKVISIGSSSDSPRAIQWFHNGQPVPGATNSILTIDPPQPAADGYYVAQIDNFAGRVVSAMADAQIDGNGGGLVLFSNHTDAIDAPIYSPGQEPGAPPYIRVKLFAGATINRMRPVTDWIKATNGYFNAGVISLPQIAPGQKAYGQVFAMDEIPMLLESPLFGRSPIMEITAGATPTPLLGQIPMTLVKYGHYLRPQFTPDTPPSVRQGASVELKFSLLDSNNLPLTYFWSKNGVPIPGATNATLRIDNAQRSDAGYYTVFMTNGTDAPQIGTALAVEDSIALRLSSDGALELRGNAGSQYTLQSSSDLKTWSTLQTMTAGSDATTIPVVAPSSGNLFYRAILESPQP
jgi:hypothetical protein